MYVNVRHKLWKENTTRYKERKKEKKKERKKCERMSEGKKNLTYCGKNEDNIL